MFKGKKTVERQREEMELRTAAELKLLQSGGHFVADSPSAAGAQLLGALQVEWGGNKANKGAIEALLR